MTTVGVSYLVYFYLSQFVKARLLRAGPTVTAAQSLLSSWLAGVGTVLITDPLWVVSQNQRTSTAPLTTTVRKLWKAEGVKGFYRGLAASLWLVTNPVIQFVAYEQLKRLLSRPSTLATFFLGGVAKALATVATYPLQVVQTRHRGSAVNLTMIASLRVLFEKEGVAGMYRGFQAKSAQTCLNSAFMFVFYEHLLKLSRKLVGT
jgi:adenine nucleotide transporter 17